MVPSRSRETTVLFKPTFAAEMSGSMGGFVASHNRGGQYLRIRVVPTDPQSANQIAIRNSVGTLSTRWSSTLTADQRAEWATYAQQVPLPNRLGDPRLVSPLAHFIRSNTPRLQAGLGVVDDGPAILNTGDFNALNAGLAATATAGTIDVFFDNADSWATTTGGALLVYLSQPKPVTVNFFKGPYRFVSGINGATTTPPVSPASGIAVAWPFSVGQKLFWQLRATTSDGRLSFVARGSVVAT